MAHTDKHKNPKDKWILIYFLMFFGVIFTVNGIFAYMAVSSHTGLITENPYEKGLAFNQILQKQSAQPKMKDKITIEDGIISWYLFDDNDMAVTNATVRARIIRPVSGGHDMDITLIHQGSGLYQTTLNLPLKGKWHAQLEAKWNTLTYRIKHNFLIQ